MIRCHIDFVQNETHCGYFSVTHIRDKSPVDSEYGFIIKFSLQIKNCKLTPILKQNLFCKWLNKPFLYS